MKKVNKGILLALTTAVISGFANFIAKVGVSVADPFVHTSLRVSIVAGVLTLLVHYKYGFNKVVNISAKNKIKLLAVGLVGGSIPFMLFFVGLTKTTAVSAALIHKTLYIWVAFLAIFFLKEKITFKQMIGYLLVLWANQFLFKSTRFNFGVGELMILTATILWSIENVLAKTVLRDVKPIIVAWARMATGALVITSTTLILGKGGMLISLSIPQITTVLAGATTLLFYVLTWYTALSFAPATLVAALLVPATLITNILTGLFVTHTLTFPQVAHGILVVLGVGIIVYFSYYVKKWPSRVFKV
jgi:drug/metabolite transporter (DMT)-like permease